jgi:hypothetical protein
MQDLQETGLTYSLETIPTRTNANLDAVSLMKQRDNAMLVS